MGIDKEMLEAIGQMMDAKLDERDERLSQMMDAKLSTVKDEMSQMMDAKLEPLKADMAEVKQRSTRIEVTLENDISKKLGALHDGHQLNTELLREVRDSVSDMESTVAALDVLHSFPSDKPLTIKIVK